MAAVHYPGTPGTILYGGRAAVAPGSDLTTLTLQNESASVQAAGFVSPMFGMPFKQGDMPAGSYPRFELTDGTLCPATLWGVTSWPDGSMKFCGAMIRVPAAVPGSGTLAITVKSGGIAPGASARSTADLTSADLKVEATGITNLSGVWVASLNDAIADGSDIVVIGDGPAGKVWRIGGHFRQAGAPHGQLYCWHYVTALQDSSGGLLGLRYLGRAAQPFADVTSPTPTRRVLTAALKSSAATLRALQGHDSTETVGANIGMPHYTSFFTAGTDGRWDFVQGGGSALADCTVRVQHDKTYVVKSRIVPPYSTSLVPTSGVSVDYYPMGRGSMQRNMGGTGERDDIGVLPSWSVRHLMTQSALDERIVRVNGLVPSSWRQCARKKTTGQIVPVTDPSPSYTGMGTNEVLWRGPVTNLRGFVVPADNTSMWNQEYEPSHRPDGCFYPYLITGEPQYLDMMVEYANGIISGAVSESRTMRTTLPISQGTVTANSDYGERDVIINGTNYKGGAYFFTGNLARVAAWGTRDMAHAAAIYPDVCPYGTQVKKYFSEICENGFAAMNAYNQALGAEWAGSGIYCFDERSDAAAPWCNGYFSNSVCHQSSILATASSATFRAYLAQYWERLALNRDFATVSSFDGSIYVDGGARVTKAEDVLTSIDTPLVFSTSTSRFTVTASAKRVAWQPTNGDVIAFLTKFDADKPFSEAVDCKRFYVVNASGVTGQLALTPGGSPITVTSDVTVSTVFARVQNFAPNITAENISPSAYIANINSAVRHHAALGDSVATAVTESAEKMSASGISFVSDPKNAIEAAYPGA